MFFMPYNFFFFMSLLLSIMISISSMNWIWVWVGMEINMLSFIPLMKSVKDNYIFSVVECSVKYFMVQAMGSGIFLLGYMLMLMKYFSLFNSFLSLILIMLSLLIKVGAAPFHFWFPMVMKGLCWFSCGILMIFQKIIPLIILSSMLNGDLSLYLLLFCMLGSLVGGVGGLNQINLRVLCTFFTNKSNMFINKLFLLMNGMAYYKNKMSKKKMIDFKGNYFAIFFNLFYINSSFFSKRIFFNNKMIYFFSSLIFKKKSSLNVKIEFFFSIWITFLVMKKKRFFMLLVYNNMLLKLKYSIYYKKDNMKLEDMLVKVSSLNNLLIAFNLMKENMNYFKFFELKKLSEDLYSGQFMFNPIQYILVLKSDNFFYFLIPSFVDKLVHQAMKQQLEMIFEFFMSNYSYGFRVNTYMHNMMLKDFKLKYKDYKWMIKGDMGGMGSMYNMSLEFNDILFLKIFMFVNDKMFMNLMEKYFKSGYLISSFKMVIDGIFFSSSFLSPLLINIIFYDLDLFMELFLNNMKFLYYNNMFSTNDFSYIRYNNNFIFGFLNGNNFFIFCMKLNLFKFMQKMKWSLKLCILSYKFISYFFFMGMIVFMKEVKFYIPIDFIIKNLILKGIGYIIVNNFFLKWQPSQVGFLIHSSDYKIVNFFSNKWWKLWGYYKVCDNVASMSKIFFLMKYSCAKTLSFKYNKELNSLRKVFCIFSLNLIICNYNNMVMSWFPEQFFKKEVNLNMMTYNINIFSFFYMVFNNSIFIKCFNCGSVQNIFFISMPFMLLMNYKKYSSSTICFFCFKLNNN